MPRPALAHRRPLVRATVAVAGLALLAACTSSGGTTASGPQTAATQPGASGGAAPSTAATATAASAPVTLDSNVAPDATGVPVDTVVSASAAGGALVSVELSYQDAKAAKVAVAGEVSPDSSTWTAGGLLEPSTTYTLAIVGRSNDGAELSAKRTFTTLALSNKQQFTATIIQNGATVGVAMPVIVKFSGPIKDQAAVERRLKVTSVPAQPGGWAWYSNNEIHFRPKVYWQPGTKVSVTAGINGVSAGNGSYGKDDKTGGFTVGSSTIMKADLTSHQMQVIQDGQLVRTVPISGGRPGNASRSGVKVISEKYENIVMDSATVGIPKGSPGYYRTDVKWAMRETWSGEFIHSAPWSVGSQGRANVSHGCLNVSPANAQWLFGIVKVGDPVETVNSGRNLERGNGWTDWTTSFEDFVKYSALAPGGGQPTG
jgi:lipoprotein-anchoring transpeptidase ErfK/SrfK